MVDAQGLKLQFSQVAIRNLLRVVDLLPVEDCVQQPVTDLPLLEWVEFDGEGVVDFLEVVADA